MCICSHREHSWSWWWWWGAQHGWWRQAPRPWTHKSRCLSGPRTPATCSWWTWRCWWSTTTTGHKELENLSATIAKSSFLMPVPLSWIWSSFKPPPRTVTFTWDPIWDARTLKLRIIIRDLRGEEKGFGLREPIFKTCVLPASSAFSRSSFKAFAGRWITSPAAILFTTTFQRPFYFSWHLCSVDNSLSNTRNPIIALPRRAF